MRALLLCCFAVSTAAAQPSVHRGPPPLPPPLVEPLPRYFFSFSAGSGVGVINDGETEGLEADVKGGFQFAPLQIRAELAAIRTREYAIGIAARVGFPLGVDIGNPPASKA